MRFKRKTLEDCNEVTGTVVVIDVLRAFSTAAYAFAAGAGSITLVGTVEEAFERREAMKGAMIMGEVDGLPVPGFDFSNSPAAFDRLDLAGRPMIQRTSRGTQGVIKSSNADRLFACGFCCASATARLILAEAPEEVSFVITGAGPNGRGDEDAACADFLEALLNGARPDPAPFISRVYTSPAGLRFSDPCQPDFPPGDLDYCTRVDLFDFAMPVFRCNGLPVLKTMVP